MLPVKSGFVFRVWNTHNQGYSALPLAGEKTGLRPSWAFKLSGHTRGCEMQKIQLTKGCIALVDDDDYEYLNQFKWRLADTNQWTKYAQTAIKINGKYKTFLMHRMIMNPLKNLQVDHINHNGLDNTKNNLRICTRSENCRHFRRMIKFNDFGFKGIKFKDNGWEAEIRINGKQKYLGRSKNPIEAAKIYNIAALKYFGDYAVLNPL